MNINPTGYQHTHSMPCQASYKLNINFSVLKITKHMWKANTNMAMVMQLITNEFVKQTHCGCFKSMYQDKSNSTLGSQTELVLEIWK